MENIAAELLKWLANAGVKILVAFAVIFISFPVINHFTNVIKKYVSKEMLTKLSENLLDMYLNSEQRSS